MRISFDLDDTLILRGVPGPVEPGLLPRERPHAPGERLRLGTRALLLALARDGWEIVVYTDSTRGCSSLRSWFAACGLPLHEVINKQRHEAMAESRGQPGRAKFPPWFGIDLHVDDASDVLADGQRSGYRVLLVCPHDIGWTDAVLAAARQCKAIPGGQSACAQRGKEAL